MTTSPMPVIQIWDIEKLKPYEANAKKHSDDQVRKLATLISKSGWTQPIVVDKDGVIIAGHGRRLAALHLGLKRVPVVVRDDLTKAEADALRLADNRVTSTEYDQAAIQEELRRLADALQDSVLDLGDLGFDAKEIDFSMADLGSMDESFFVEDVAEAVERQQDENRDSAAKVDETAAPVSDALGFKRITIAESRTLRGLMTEVESRTGQKGVAALISALSAYSSPANAGN